MAVEKQASSEAEKSKGEWGKQDANPNTGADTDKGNSGDKTPTNR